MKSLFRYHNLTVRYKMNDTFLVRHRLTTEQRPVATERAASEMAETCLLTTWPILTIVLYVYTLAFVGIPFHGCVMWLKKLFQHILSSNVIYFSISPRWCLISPWAVGIHCLIVAERDYIFYKINKPIIQKQSNPKLNTLYYLLILQWWNDCFFVQCSYKVHIKS